MLNFAKKAKELFTMPTLAGSASEEEESGGFAWNQSARTILAILFVIVSGFVVFWIMS